jgi:hypothetical protein
MTEHDRRTGVPRDVPPPRPIASPTAPVPVEETGLGRAARALAEAVSGLVGGAGGPADADAGNGTRRSAATGLSDVIGAVAGAVGAAFGPGRATGAPPTAGAAEASTPTGDRSPGALLGDLLAATAPRLPIRDADRLRRAYPGASDAEIADQLVARAARMTGGIGAATGGLSAAHWFAPPSLLALPLELGAETVLIAAVEVVLIGELHELYGQPSRGDARGRAAAYLASWSAQRSVAGAGAAGLGSLLGSAGVRALRRRVTRRLAGNVTTAAPFLLGAALANRSNRRATEALAGKVLDDLRGSRPVGPDGPGPRR